MPKRCARCGALRRIRELTVPGEWVSYLRNERDLAAPVGTLRMPLCRDCYADADDVLDGDGGASADREAFLDAVDPDALVDDGV